MTYSVKNVNEFLRFYCDGELIQPLKIPRLTYFHLLGKYSKMKNIHLYFSTLPYELRQQLLFHVNLETLDLLTDEFHEFSSVADHKFWRELLLTDVCRNLKTDIIYDKNDYMRPMLFVKEYHRMMRCCAYKYYYDEYELTVIMKSINFTPELLIEQLLIFYPKVWNTHLLESFVTSTTTIDFLENFVALSSNEGDRVYAQCYCLMRALATGNKVLVDYLSSRGVEKLRYYDS